MNRVVTTAAAAARAAAARAAAAVAAAAVASALLSAAGVREARGQLVYDSFAYPAATPLEGKVNPINGQPWATMSANAADDDVLMSSGSLSYSALAAPAGNSASFGGVGKSQRIGFEKTARSGAMYYSLVLRVGSLGDVTETPTFIAGFSDRPGESGLQPTTVGTRLYLRKGPSSAPGAERFQLGVSKNSTFDIAFDEAVEYPVGGTPLLVVGSYEIVGTTSGTNDIAKLYVNPTSLGSASAPTAQTSTARIITAPEAGTDLTISGVPSVGGFVLRQGSSLATTVPNVQVDELRIDSAWARVTPPAGVAWNVDGGGAWSEGAKWSTLSSPNSADVFVNFNGNITAPRTINVDTPVALRTINFSSNQPYTLGAGGGGALNFSASAGINVRGGNHTIAAPISLGGEMLISVATGTSLHLTGNLSGGGNGIIKAGDGALTVKHLRGGAAEIVAGTVTVAPSGGAAAASRVASLAIGPEATLDLKNNKLLTDTPAGTFTGGAYTGVHGEVARAYNSGAWNQPGLKTSMPEAGPTVGTATIGVASAQQILFIAPTATGTFAGQPVTGATTIAMYTYAGDLNLDGRVDAQDYGIIDNWIQFPGTSGYANGDINYDGAIDAADYGIIDNTIQLQGPPIPISGDVAAAAEMSGVTAVPEPSAVVVAALTTIAGALARRRR